MKRATNAEKCVCVCGCVGEMVAVAMTPMAWQEEGKHLLGGCK